MARIITIEIVLNDEDSEAYKDVCAELAIEDFVKVEPSCEMRIVGDHR